MAEVKWIKITTNVFDDEKIMLIDSMPDNDALIVIWFKLLALAGKCNNGGMLTLSDKIAYTDEMLATVFRRPLNTVRMALSTFEQFGMIESEEVISIANWEKHQNIEGMEKIREDTRKRVARHREKKKQKLLEQDVTLQVTQCNAIGEEREEEQEKENNKDIVELETSTIYPYTEIIDYLNTKANTKYRSSTKKTQALIKARFNENFTLEDFKTVIDKKCKEWLGTKMEMYLKPDTLFSPKFEGYLNQNIVEESKYQKPIKETPQWFDKAIEKQAPTKEDEERIKKMLRKYGDNENEKN